MYHLKKHKRFKKKKSSSKIVHRLRFLSVLKKISMKNLRKVERTFVIDLHEHDLFACNHVCTPRLQGNRERKREREKEVITSNSKNSDFWLHRKLQSGSTKSLPIYAFE